MIERVYQLANASAAVRSALMKGSKLNFYGFGEAPPGVATPYAIWQYVGGLPENKLSGIPDDDTYSIQIDAYGTTQEECRAAGIALRDAFELDGYVVSYNFEGREPETRLYRRSFTIELMLSRAQVGS